MTYINKMQAGREGIRAVTEEPARRVARRYRLNAPGKVTREYMYNSTTDSADR